MSNSNVLTKGRVRVEWTELGEGIDGDYNPEDPDDIELLRFDVSLKVGGRWTFPDNASYCTQVPVKATAKQKSALLKTIMFYVYDPLISGQSIKRCCEELSWISLESLKSNKIERKYVL